MTLREQAIYYLDREARWKAKAILSKWVTEHPQDTYAHMELVWCFYKDDDNEDGWRKCNEFYQAEYRAGNRAAVRRFVTGEQLFYEGKYEEAAAEYNAAIEAGLDDPVVWHSLAVAFRHNKRHDDMQRAFETVLSRDPEFLPTIEVYSRWLFAAGRYGLVEELYERIRPMGSDRFVGKFRDAKDDLGTVHDLAEASRTLRQAIDLYREEKPQDGVLRLWPVFRKHKQNCGILRTLVYLFHRARWLEFGKKRLERQLRDSGPYAHYARGLVYWYEDQHEKALEEYDKAIDAGLQHPLVHCGKALVLEELEQKDQEDAEFQTAHQRQPWLLYAVADLAENAFERSDWDEAIRLADIDEPTRQQAQIYEVTGHRAVARLERFAIRSLMQKGHADEAAKRAEVSLDDGTSPSLSLTRACAFFAVGRRRKGNTALSAAFREDEDALGYAHDGDWAILAKAAEGKCVEYEVRLCDALQPAYEKNYVESLERLSRLTTSAPQRPEAWYHRGYIAYLADKAEEALACFKRASECDPSYKPAVGSMCSLLEKSADLTGLLELAQNSSATEMCLQAALRVAKEKKDSDRENEIVESLLENNDSDVAALVFLIEQSDQDSREFAQLLDKLLTNSPFDFERRLFVAERLMRHGCINTAFKKLMELIADGFDTTQAVLLCAIARASLSSSEIE